MSDGCHVGRERLVQARRPLLAEIIYKEQSMLYFKQYLSLGLLTFFTDCL